jgi:CRP-like cAMP-binding protein
MFRAGDVVENIYFIASGTINIVVTMEDHEIILDKLTAGSVVGFNGLLNYSHYTFTARSETKASLYSLSLENLKSVLAMCEDVYKSVNSARDYYKKEPLPYVDY